MDLSGIDRLLGSLNEHQARAAAVGPGKAAVTGVPGSGKTRVLTARLARLAKDNYSLSWCLAMTFTRAAAGEINSRLEKLGLGAGRVGTIHSVCNEVLLGPGADLVDGLHIDDTGWRTQMLLRRCLSVERYKHYRYDFDEVRCYIEACKATGICPVFGNPFGLNLAAYKRIERVAEGWTSKAGLPAWALSRVYDELEGMRSGNRLYSFDDMQLWAWMLLLVKPETLQHLQAQWQLIMIDEAQDSNPVQWDLAYMLARMGSQLTDKVEPLTPDKQHLMVLGDPSQSLYGFRSASPGTFVDFTKQKDTGLYILPVNYRSVPEICDAGTGLVIKESWHLGGKMEWGGAETPAALQDGRPSLEIVEHNELGMEARWVIKEAMKVHAQTGSWRSCAILSRLSTFLNVVEIECIRQNIPYEKRASGTFAGGREVVGLVAYLRVAGGWDPTGSWERVIVNCPFRYIGKPALSAADIAHAGHESYLQTLRERGGLSLRQQRSISDLQDVVCALRARMEDGMTPRELIAYVLKQTHFEESLRKESGGLAPDAAKLAALQQVEWLASMFTSVKDFVVFMDQLNEGVKIGRKKLQTKDTSIDALVLSTIHSAKGLEWPVVYLCDVVQGRHPWGRAHSIDEELRLAYVGVTRAMYRCVVSHSTLGSDMESFIITKLKKLTHFPSNVTTPEHDSGIQLPPTECAETPSNVTAT